MVRCDMPKYRKNRNDVEYYVFGRKCPVTGSTKAMSDFLAIMHEKYPTATVSQLREIITVKRKSVLFPEAVAVHDVPVRAKRHVEFKGWR